MTDKRRTENNSCNVLFLPSLMVCYNWHTDLCTIMPGWTVCYGFPKDFLWELLWNILTPKLWSMLKLIFFYLFESKNSCLPMLAGNVKKMLAWKKKKKKKESTPLQNNNKKTISDFKKAWYTHLFQLNSAREWERTAHKGFDLAHFQVIRNFLSDLNGTKIKPREHNRAATWSWGIDCKPCVLFEIVCLTLRLNRLA